eukprot:COSAG02_NODE_34082_length_489_cov_10.784615_1_plen_24_part_10
MIWTRCVCLCGWQGEAALIYEIAD